MPSRLAYQFVWHSPTWLFIAWLFIAGLLGSAAVAAEPIRLHPDNPHYFVWRGRPAVLVTSGEHYGAVLNADFDYAKYLQTLQVHGFNLTRVFSGTYCEPQGAFGIERNTLAPAAGRLICPWARSDTPGYAGGGNKFDLLRFDPAYFARLRDFVATAGRHGIVVELVLFCTMYDEAAWRLSPLHASNNVNGIGQVARQDAFALQDERLTDVQLALARQCARELNEFDNVYFEICNEPYERAGQTLAWQSRIAVAIADAERDLPHRHLIAQNLPWRAADQPRGKSKRDQLAPAAEFVSLINFHGRVPAATVARNYGRNVPLALDETGDRSVDALRTSAWEFLLAGGAVFDALDLSFAVGHEDGSFTGNGSQGGPEFRRQLKVLHGFLQQLPLVRMRPDEGIVRGGVPAGGTVVALSHPGKTYAVYIRGGQTREVTLRLPPGRYAGRWLDPRTGEEAPTGTIDGGDQSLSLPQYRVDIALTIERED